MTELNVQIKNKDGDLLYPKTKAAIVYNNSNESLGTVEAGAEVNIIEEVQVNGVALTPDANRAVNVVIPAADEYTIVKDNEAASGYAATYHLTKNNVNVGAAINIPKDMVVQSGTVETCVQDDVPVAGYVVGDKYIDLVLANADSSHIYILVSDLIDIYTEGDGINIAGNVISVDTTDTAIADATPTENSTKLVQSGGVYTALAGKVNTLQSPETAGTYTKVTIDAQGLVSAGDTLVEADIPALASSKVTLMTSYAKASASAAIETTDTLNQAIGKLEYKADNAVVKNANITGATKCKITYDEKGLVTAGDDLAASDIPNLDSAKVTSMSSYAKAQSASAIATTDSLNDAMGKLEYRVDSALYYEVLE